MIEQQQLSRHNQRERKAPALKEAAKKRGRPKRRPGAAKAGSREELMRAALWLFADRGVEHVTIKDIALASGFDSALIYYYFEDKHDLFKQTVRFGLAEALDAHRDLQDDDGDPAAAIRHWFDYCIKMAETNRALVRVMLHYADTEFTRSALTRPIRDFYEFEEKEILKTNMKEGVKRGIFAACDVTALAHFVSIHMDGITVASIIREDFDIVAAFRALEEDLWSRLDYRADAGAARAKVKR